MPNSGRQRLVSTPRLDAWRTGLRTALEPRGAKTDLARFMAGERGTPGDAKAIHGWRVRINRMLRDHEVMNAEDVLAITAWMASRTA